MKEYNVKQISKLLDTNPETVRRWIRSGKLVASLNSKKDGNIITEAALLEFIKNTPKYAGAVAGIAAVVPSVAIPVMMGAVISGIARTLYTGRDQKISTTEMQSYLEREIQQSNMRIEKKQEAIDQLQSELENERQQLEALQYLKEHADLDSVAAEINKKI